MRPDGTQPIKDLLQRLMTVMTDLGSEAPSHLQPGLTREEIIATFDKLEITPSEDLIGFYEFSNGVVAEGKGDEIDIFHHFHILPLEHAVAEYGYGAFAFDEIEDINKSCFPILKGWGSVYLIDLEAERNGQPSILSYDPELPAEMEFSNLRSMIQTLIAAYEQEAARGESIDFDEDYEGPDIGAVAQKYNPDVPKWNGGPLRGINFPESREVMPQYDAMTGMLPLAVAFTKSELGPKATLYVASYVDAKSVPVYAAAIIVPQTEALPPVAYVNLPPRAMRIADEQIIERASKDIRNYYEIVVDVTSSASVNWRDKMPQYLQMLRGV